MSNAKVFIEGIYREIHDSCGNRLWKDSVNMLNTVSESIFSRSAHFIIELLQNAEDAGPKDCPPNGEIEFSISQKQILVCHNGIPFTNANADAICGVRSTKKPEFGTLGFLGIGFKSVFRITDCPEIHSGDFHFKFDKEAHDDPAITPWQIMPIWVNVLPEPSGFTTFVLPFRSADFYKQTRDELKKLDVHVFLFLKWFKRLTIIDESDGQHTVIKNLGEQDGFARLIKNETEQRFVIIKRTAAVPAEIAADPELVFYKRQNVILREVVIAFAVDKNGNLQPIDDASALGSVSSFLPLVEERSGAKFLIRADFLVHPGREAIQYELAWNHWLVREAVEAAKDAIKKFKAGLTKFFRDRTHVQAIDYEKICRDVFLPKIRTDSPKPSSDELIAYTRLLQKVPRITESVPIWVLTKRGDLKPSNQCFMGMVYSPAENWEKNSEYSPQIDFLGEEYLRGVPVAELGSWKEFFRKTGVKESGENNHVETFAIGFIEKKLENELTEFIPKDSQHVGYDREARRRQGGGLVKLECKGLKKDRYVQLVGNEPEAAKTARTNGEEFWVCVVTGIPEEPQCWIVENAIAAGKSNILTIDVTAWRTFGRRLA